MPRVATSVAWGRRWVLPVAAAGVVTLVVAWLARRLLLSSSAVGRWDAEVVRSAETFARAHGTLAEVLLTWQAVTQPVVGYVALILVAVLMWNRGPTRVQTRCAFVIAIALVGWLLSAVAKLAVQRARPALDDPITILSGYSFPSGHAAGAALAGSLWVILLWPLLHRRGRATLVAAVSLFVTATCLDRVLLGVHYPSDVIGGVVLGVGIVTAAWAVRARWSEGLSDTHR